MKFESKSNKGREEMLKNLPIEKIIDPNHAFLVCKEFLDHLREEYPQRKYISMNLLEQIDPHSQDGPENLITYRLRVRGETVGVVTGDNLGKRSFWGFTLLVSPAFRNTSAAMKLMEAVKIDFDEVYLIPSPLEEKSNPQVADTRRRALSSFYSRLGFVPDLEKEDELSLQDPFSDPPPVMVWRKPNIKNDV